MDEKKLKNTFNTGYIEDFIYACYHTRQCDESRRKISEDILNYLKVNFPQVYNDFDHNRSQTLSLTENDQLFKYFTGRGETQ